MALFIKWSIFLLGLNMHDIPVTMYNLSFSEQETKLVVKIDIEDLKLISDDEINKKMIQSKFEEGIEFKLDNEEINFQLHTFSMDHEFYTLVFHSPKTTFKNKTLMLKTTLLVEEDSEHSNIIKVKYQDKTRGFRLHKERLTTSMTMN